MNHIIYFLGFVFLRDAVKPWFPVFRNTQLLLEWALTSSVLILIVLAVRRLFKEKLSARLRYALWGVVLLRLLVPFQIQLPAAAGDALPVLASNLAPEPPASWDERDIPVFSGGEQPIEEMDFEYQTFQPGYLGPGPWSDGCIGLSEDGKTVTPYADIFTRNEVIQSIWWVGTLGMAAALLVSNLRFFIRLEERRKQLEVPDSRVRVYVAEGLPSPCLFGVFKPAVYVTPEAAEDPDTLRHVLAHELTHYAHKDHLWSLLRCLALALHWYNPLVWLAVGLSKGDGELACDEGAVARLGETERIPYGRTLIDMVAARSLRPGDLLSCSTAMTGGKKSIQQRIALLVKKPETVRAALFAAIAVVALGLVFTFAGRKDEPASPELEAFLADLDSASSIRYYPPSYSSQYYPEAITDTRLLANAREYLSDLVPLEAEDAAPDGKQLLDASRIVLTTEEGEVTYNLIPYNDYTYVTRGSGDYFVQENGRTAFLRTGGKTDLSGSIAALARTSGALSGSALRGDLTREQVEQVNEAFRPDVELPDGSWGPSEISCFFTSSYDDPTQIDLKEFLAYCPLWEGVDEQTDREEYRDVLEATWPTGVAPDLDDFLLPTPMWRYPREKVSALLQKYAGVTVDRLDWGDMLYLEKYDAFYNFTSDYGPGFFHCEGGEISEDTVRLWSEPDGEGNRCELTLRKNGENWLIRSHHTVYER